MIWYKDNVPITELNKEKNAKNNFTIKANGMTLAIRPLTAMAEGEYKCVAKNTVSETSKIGFLTVNGTYRKKSQTLF